MVRAVKPGKKSGVAAFFGCNPRHESVAQSEAPIDVFSLAPGAGSSADTGTRGHAASTSGSVVTVNHRLAEKDGVNLLPTEVTNHSAAAGHVTASSPLIGCRSPSAWPTSGWGRCPRWCSASRRGPSTTA